MEYSRDYETEDEKSEVPEDPTLSHGGLPAESGETLERQSVRTDSGEMGRRSRKARRRRKRTKRTVTKIPRHVILRMMMTTSERKRHAVTTALPTPVALNPHLGPLLGPSSAGLGFYV